MIIATNTIMHQRGTAAFLLSTSYNKNGAQMLELQVIPN